MQQNSNTTPIDNIMGMFSNLRAGKEIWNYLAEKKCTPESCFIYGPIIEIDTLEPEGATIDHVMKFFGNHDVDILEYSLSVRLYMDEDQNFHNHIQIHIIGYDS